MGLIYVVTGASQIFGAEFVKQLSERGDTVIACTYHPDQSEQLKALVNGKNVHAVAIDTTNLDSIEHATEQIQQLAPDGIDVLINNSGLLYNNESNESERIYRDRPASNYIEAFETHIGGTFNMTHALVPLLRNRTTRAIVNISSILTSMKEIKKEVSIYNNTSSDGETPENMLTRDFAIYLGDEDFVVFAMCPMIQEPSCSRISSTATNGWLKLSKKYDDDWIQPTPEQSIRGMLLIIDKHSKDLNGAYVSFEDENLPW
ncbi:hypothetical protein BDA99DRAFT_550066 [Phascolomyces articulosus]|uniref:Uncharacterized protein n=1 Tax=Phascolomyces articulosus TaxID=60185 RepID=A0AAD5PI51_9FUNG|nr:hypothetical protein BDA99DRAFT_550066 [Phascolomyces articulosus]